MIRLAISTFVDSLNANWAGVQELAKVTDQKGLVADWMQASWEAIVEASVPTGLKPVRLVVYGDGADIHRRSSRFSSPEDQPTHEIRCWPANDNVIDRLSGASMPGKVDGYALDRFVTAEAQWYRETPPFDFALLTANGEEFVVPIEHLIWKVVEVESPRV